MSHKMLRPCIVKVSVLGYFPLHLKKIKRYNNIAHNKKKLNQILNSITISVKHIFCI